MKRTSRKKVLLSSVAMMMVATVSLGSATFAWFSTKTTAEANNINVKSSKASGLLISEDDASWSSVINYANTANNRADVLEPVSSAFESLTSPVFLKGIAADPSSYEVDDSGFTTAAYTTAAGLVNVYDLYAKTADGAEEELIISVDETGLTDAGGYGRIAIVRYENDNIEGDADVMKVYYMAAEGAEETAVYPVKSDLSIASAYPITPVNSISEINLGKISTSTHFKIFVWNEGQDNDCTTTNADKAIRCNFDLKLAD